MDIIETNLTVYRNSTDEGLILSDLVSNVSINKGDVSNVGTDTVSDGIASEMEIEFINGSDKILNPLVKQGTIEYKQETISGDGSQEYNVSENHLLNCTTLSKKIPVKITGNLNNQIKFGKNITSNIDIQYTYLDKSNNNPYNYTDGEYLPAIWENRKIQLTGKLGEVQYRELMIEGDGSANYDISDEIDVSKIVRDSVTIKYINTKIDWDSLSSWDNTSGWTYIDSSKDRYKNKEVTVNYDTNEVVFTGNAPPPGVIITLQFGYIDANQRVLFEGYIDDISYSDDSISVTALDNSKLLQDAYINTNENGYGLIRNYNVKRWSDTSIDGEKTADKEITTDGDTTSYLSSGDLFNFGGDVYVVDTISAGGITATTDINSDKGSILYEELRIIDNLNDITYNDGIPIETFIQNCLDDYFGDDAEEIKIEGALNWNVVAVLNKITEYKTLWDLFQEVATQRGIFIGYRYDKISDSFKLTLKTIDRDFDISSNQDHTLYYSKDILKQNIDITGRDIKNSIIVRYVNKSQEKTYYKATDLSNKSTLGGLNSSDHNQLINVSDTSIFDVGDYIHYNNQIRRINSKTLDTITVNTNFDPNDLLWSDGSGIVTLCGDSIQKYGLRTAGIEEQSSSLISNSEEAKVFSESILSDTKDLFPQTKLNIPFNYDILPFDVLKVINPYEYTDGDSDKLEYYAVESVSHNFDFENPSFSTEIVGNGNRIRGGKTRWRRLQTRNGGTKPITSEKLSNIKKITPPNNIELSGDYILKSKGDSVKISQKISFVSPIKETKVNFELQIKESDQNWTQSIKYSSKDTQFNVEIEQNTSYNVKIRAVDNTGKKGKWSDTFNFTTDTLIIANSTATITNLDQFTEWYEKLPTSPTGTDSRGIEKVIFKDINITYNFSVDRFINNDIEIQSINANLTLKFESTALYFLQITSNTKIIGDLKINVHNNTDSTIALFYHHSGNNISIKYIGIESTAYDTFIYFHQANPGSILNDSSIIANECVLDDFYVDFNVEIYEDKTNQISIYNCHFKADISSAQKYLINGDLYNVSIINSIIQNKILIGEIINNLTFNSNKILLTQDLDENLDERRSIIHCPLSGTQENITVYGNQLIYKASGGYKDYYFFDLNDVDMINITNNVAQGSEWLSDWLVGSTFSTGNISLNIKK